MSLEDLHSDPRYLELKPQYEELEYKIELKRREIDELIKQEREIGAEILNLSLIHI